MKLICIQGRTNLVLNHFVSFRYASFNKEIVRDQKTHLIQLSLQDKPENPEFPLTNKNMFKVDRRDKYQSITKEREK